MYVCMYVCMYSLNFFTAGCVTWSVLSGVLLFGIQSFPPPRPVSTSKFSISYLFTNSLKENVLIHIFLKSIITL